MRYRYRIHCQPTGRLGVDRWACIFVGTPTHNQRCKQKGLWFRVETKKDADALADVLLTKAQEACVLGQAQKFIDHWNARIDQQRHTLEPPGWP